MNRLGRFGRAVQRDLDRLRNEREANRALEAGVRERVNGKWVIPAPSYFEHNRRAA